MLTVNDFKIVVNEQTFQPMVLVNGDAITPEIAKDVLTATEHWTYEEFMNRLEEVPIKDETVELLLEFAYRNEKR